MENNSSQEILEAIKKSERVLIPLHFGPDGDSLASCIVMKYILERDFNKKVKVISKDKLTENFNAFDFVKDIEFGKGIEDIDLNDFDILLFLDHSNKPELKQKKIIINIDHHKTNAYWGDFNYIDDDRPSTCSILIDLFNEWKVKFDKKIADLFFIGVYTDTSGFSIVSTKTGLIGALKDAIFLIEKGANYKEVIDKLKYGLPLKMAKFFSKIVQNLEIKEFESYKLGVSFISNKDIKKLDLELAEIRGGSNYLQTISGIDVLLFLAEADDSIKGSFRSRKLDVAAIANELGGGGHKLAAGFFLEKMPLKDAEKKVFDAIKKIGLHRVE